MIEMAKEDTLAIGGGGRHYLSCCFNPRPREGGDKAGRTSSARRSFNPRPREGGDTKPLDTDIDICSFNPRPREGGDIANISRRTVQNGFNPRPREGGDPLNDFAVIN